MSRWEITMIISFLFLPKWPDLNVSKYVLRTSRASLQLEAETVKSWNSAVSVPTNQSS